MKHGLIIVLALFLAACGKDDGPASPQPPPGPTPPATATPAPTPSSTPGATPVVAISWEDAKHPQRVQWSKHVYTIVLNELLPKFDKVTDYSRFCSTYKDLVPQERATLWTEVVSGIAFYESSWNPLATRIEAGAIDQVTGKPGRSEGLMQLDYQMTLWYPFCKFNWSADKDKALNDPTRTILDPFINLDCGVRALAHQIDKKGTLVMPTGGFWSTLRDGTNAARYIAQKADAMEFCHPETEERPQAGYPPAQIYRGRAGETYIDENGRDIPKPLR